MCDTICPALEPSQTFASDAVRLRLSRGGDAAVLYEGPVELDLPLDQAVIGHLLPHVFLNLVLAQFSSVRLSFAAYMFNVGPKSLAVATCGRLEASTTLLGWFLDRC